MAKISKEECELRRQEILSVAKDLYTELPLKEINIKEIGQRLSFTRTAIYTYFQNKEEIYLAVLEREYTEWNQALEIIRDTPHLTREDFAHAIAQSLAKRETLLKILSVDMASLDAKSREELVISFKKAYGRSLTLVQQILEQHFPDRSADANQAFLFAFFPFLFGVYPYTEVTAKQKRAMAEADVPYVYYTAAELIENCIRSLMKEA